MPRPIPLLSLAAFAMVSTSLSLRAEEAAPAKPAETKPAEPKVSLETGSKAPEFKPTAWVQGEPVKAFEKGKVYLVECWATWCGPCVAQIPHLNGLHKKYADKGLVIIGTNVWDKDEANASKFVKEKGEAMSYRVAYDNKADGQVTREWLVAAGVNGIPHAFAVRDGVILWHGHPAMLSDSVIESMLAGTFDSAKVAAEQAASAKAANAGRAKIAEASKAVSSAIAAKDYELALKKADEFGQVVPEASRPMALAMMKLRVYSAKGDTAGALAVAGAAVKADDSNALLKLNITNALLHDKVLLADKAIAAFVVETVDAASLDARFAKNPSVLLMAAQAHHAAGDKAGALAKLKAIQADDERLKARVAACEAAVNAGEAWPK